MFLLFGYLLDYIFDGLFCDGRQYFPDYFFNHVRDELPFDCLLGEVRNNLPCDPFDDLLGRVRNVGGFPVRQGYLHPCFAV